MKWNLIFKLSLFGLAMALATVYFLPSGIEPLVWLAIFIFCAYVIAKQCTGKYFLHGLFVSILNSIWIIAVHILLFQTYVSNHLKEAEMMAKMPFHNYPRTVMFVTGLLVGVISGLVLGLFAFIASKLIKKSPATN
jgi:uncharacterized membrane protein